MLKVGACQEQPEHSLFSGGSLSLKPHSLPGQWVDFIPRREHCLWALGAGSCSFSMDRPVLAGRLSKCHAIECAHNDVFTKLYAFSNRHLSWINLSDLVVWLHVSAFPPYFGGFILKLKMLWWSVLYTSGSPYVFFMAFRNSFTSFSDTHRIMSYPLTKFLFIFLYTA